VMTASAGRASAAGPAARSTAGSPAAPSSGSPDAGMPGRSTAGDCRGIRNHAPLARRRRGIRKSGPAPLACADRSWPGSSVVDGWRRAGRKVHSGTGAPSAVTDRLWTVRGRELDCCRSPVPGNPLLLRARVSVSWTDPRGSGGRRAWSHLQGMPLQEVARRMKVLYEHVAGPASSSMPPPWPARSPTRTGRRRRWRLWPRRWRRWEKRDRRATWLRWRVPSDGGQWR
jgi:hypothetical protein